MRGPRGQRGVEVERRISRIRFRSRVCHFGLQIRGFVVFRWRKSERVEECRVEGAGQGGDRGQRFKVVCFTIAIEDFGQPSDFSTVARWL